MREGQETLWGPAQTVWELVPGICKVTTAGHGGIWVAPELFAQMPEYMRGTPYSEGGWFEEDIDWCIPFIVFEELLAKSEDARARQVIAMGAHREAFRDDYHKQRRAAWEADHVAVSQ